MAERTVASERSNREMEEQHMRMNILFSNHCTYNGSLLTLECITRHISSIVATYVDLPPMLKHLSNIHSYNIQCTYTYY